MANYKDAQVEFFNRIKEKLAPNTNLAQKIEELINVSRSTAYKLISGEFELHVDQYRILKKEFAVSIKNFYLGDPTKQSLFDLIHLPVDDMEVYLTNIRYIYQLLSEEVQRTNLSWGAMGNHISVFHILGFPDLAFLRMYARSSYETDKKPSFETFTESISAIKIKEYHLKIFQLLKQMDSTEVILESALLYYPKLILNVFHAGGFAKRDTAIHLLDQTRDMIIQIKNWSARGVKDGDGQFKLHFSNSEIPKSMMLFFKNGGSSRICKMSVGDYLMLTEGDVLGREAEDILISLTRQNACMCGVGETRRNELFNKAILEIEDAKDMLQ